MNAAGAGAFLMLSYVLAIVGVFLTVVGIVAMVKIIQIAEDVRYMRSKSDIHVKRPMSWPTILVICLGVSVVVSFLVLVMFGGIFGSLARLGGV